MASASVHVNTLGYIKSCATISDKNKGDTSRCVADYPFPLFNVAKRTAFFQEPDSFYAINIVTGEGGSNMLWCHDLFDRDCVDYRTVVRSTEISLRFGCKDMDVSRLSSCHLGECSYALDEENVSNCCQICSGTCFLCSCRCI